MGSHLPPSADWQLLGGEQNSDLRFYAGILSGTDLGAILPTEGVNLEWEGIVTYVLAKTFYTRDFKLTVNLADKTLTGWGDCI